MDRVENSQSTVDPWFVIEKDPETAKIIELGENKRYVPAHV